MLPLVGLTQMQRQGAAEPCPRQGWTGLGKTLQGCSIAERGCASKVGEAFAPERGDWDTQGGSQDGGGGMGRVRGHGRGGGARVLSLYWPPSHLPTESLPLPISCSWQGPRGGWGWVEMDAQRP